MSFHHLLAEYFPPVSKNYMSTLYYPVYKLHFLSQLSKKRLSQDFYSSSKALIALDTEGWVTKSSLDARVILWYLAATQKYSSCVSFICKNLHFLFVKNHYCKVFFHSKENENDSQRPYSKRCVIKVSIVFFYSTIFFSECTFLLVFSIIQP